MAVLWKTKQAMCHLVGKCNLTHASSSLISAGIYVSVELVQNKSTVASGSLDAPNNFKPYFYDGYYYVFYKNTTTMKVCYRKSTDGVNWDPEVDIVTYTHVAAVMAIDDKVMVTYSEPYYEAKVIVGTIQTDHTILWGSVKLLGIQSETRALSNYATKIGATRYLFTKGVSTTDDRMWTSIDDGANWTNQGVCKAVLWMFWTQHAFIPYNDGYKVEVIFSHYYEDDPDPSYLIRAKERNGSSCGTEDNIDTFRNETYLYDQAYGILIGNEVHIIYIDNSNNLKHIKATFGGSWTTVGTVKSSIAADAGLTLCYDSASGELHIIYYEATVIKRKIWDGATYSSEETLFEDETDVLRLTAYPSPLNGKIILVWQNAAPNIRFALVEI